MITVSLEIGGDVRLIKLTKLYMYTQTHYKHDVDGRRAPGARGHGSVPLNHSGKRHYENWITQAHILRVFNQLC